MRRASAVVMLAVLGANCSGCAGSIARHEVLLPAMVGAWTNIRVQVERELQRAPDPGATAAVAAADEALRIGDPVAIAAVRWDVLDMLAVRDIDRRVAALEIGPGVAESLRGRLAEFAESRAQYLRRGP